MATATNIKQADDYVMVGKDGQTRTSSELGDATLVDGGKGGEKAQFTDWKPWAYTAGGGALAYILAKKLFDDDDDDGKGKKKSGFLNSIIPYLAAVGGGLGGYAISGMGSGNGEKGRAGEAAFKVDKDGNTVMPKDVPGGGKYQGWGAAAGYAGAGAGTAKIVAKAMDRIPQRNRDAAARMIRDARNQGLRADEILARADINKHLEKAKRVRLARAGRIPAIEGTRRWLVGRGGYRGTIAGTLASLLSGIGLNYWANKADAKREAVIAARKATGLNVDD